MEVNKHLGFVAASGFTVVLHPMDTMKNESTQKCRKLSLNKDPSHKEQVPFTFCLSPELCISKLLLITR